MSAGQFLLLLGLLLGILTVIGLPWVLGRRREAEPWDSAPAYLAAIDGLIRGRRHQAIDALRRVARQETENLSAYLRLGDLLRVMGHADKAERIHAGLAARPVGDPALAMQIRESLLQDEVARGNWEEVLRLGARIAASDAQSVQALSGMIEAHLAREEWDLALARAIERERIAPGRSASTPDAIRLHAAARSLKAGRPEDARRLLEAMADDGSTFRRVLLGDALAQAGMHEKAAQQWLEYARSRPMHAGRVFERLERAYFELGRFGDLLPVYESLGQAAPSSVAALIALADMHRRRGQLDESIHVLQSILASHGEHRAARRLLARCLLASGRTSEALHEIDLLLDAESDPEEDRCTGCGRPKDRLDPRCGGCGAWSKMNE